MMSTTAARLARAVRTDIQTDALIAAVAALTNTVAAWSAADRLASLAEARLWLAAARAAANGDAHPDATDEGNRP